MEASLKFYIDKLGFAITNQWAPHDKIEWCWLSISAFIVNKSRNNAKFMLSKKQRYQYRVERKLLAILETVEPVPM